MALEEVFDDVARHNCRLVEITGGEPLLQDDVYPLMQGLLDRGFEVLLETGGHMPIDSVPDPVVAIVDVKCPASGEADAMHWPNLDQLSPHDEVKFVIQDRADYEYAKGVVADHRLSERAAAVLFSPVHGALAPEELARWILEDHAPVRLQIQAHKYIWSPGTGRLMAGSAVVLLSGGLDSTTAAAARAKGADDLRAHRELRTSARARDRRRAPRRHLARRRRTSRDLRGPVLVRRFVPRRRRRHP